VSSWVNQIIRAFPEYAFALVFIGSRPSDYGPPKYALPDNVVHLETHYLHEFWEGTREDVPSLAGDPETFDHVEALHQMFQAFPGASAPDLAELRKVAVELMPGGRLGLREFLHSTRAWEILTRQYRSYCTDPSFVDYFWTVRIMHRPLWKLADIAGGLIPVRCFHTISTGYAGFLGALLQVTRRLPLILTEHGIYTKERKIDLYQSEWIHDNRNVFQKDPAELSYFRQMWIRFFEWLGRFCYDAADPIIALYEANRQRQIADGAPRERTRSIPNGVDLPRLAALRARRPAEDPPPVLCLIGRVVPIKDVKTFIRAMRVLANRLPGAQGWIAGPTEEDPDYAEECRNLTESLGLMDQVKFLGFQKIDELLPRIGLVVLSSISEALPLVILEGFAAGVPAISTDVGACRQLVEGLEGEDRALGAAGRVVRIADPQQLAEAALELLGDQAAWRGAQAAGIARVERYYTDTLMFDRYREVYAGALGAAAQGLGDAWLA
jgi:glycosyltransferase involved in cell wall biosynthesis